MEPFSRLVCRECGGVGCEDCDEGYQWPRPWGEDAPQDGFGEMVFYFRKGEADTTNEES